MSDPSFSDTVNRVKGAERNVTAKERDFWNNSKPKARVNLLRGRLSNSDVTSNLGLETATENAYQQDYMAKINQIINTSYDSLPESIRTTITEALIGQGALPDPETYKGVGYEFAVSKEVFLECDRCDQEFLTEEDFDIHKELDHGDQENAEEEEEAEDILAHMKDPEISLEAFKEARRLLTETDEGDLHRSVYFNGDKFPQATITEPDDIKGKRGYDDNPNKGLYDNIIFTKGKSTSRYGGVVSESFAKEDDKMTEFPCDKCGKTFDNPAEQAEHYMKNHNEEVGYEGAGDEDVQYDQSQTLSDITAVEEKDEVPEEISSLNNIDFAEEKVDFVFPTIKKKASEEFKEEKDPFLEEYGDDNIETDKEAVENQIVSRKLHGFSTEAIAREITIQYGVSHDEALKKIYSIEVSVNDQVANTFFQKRYHECTEAEKDELRAYSGSDTEDDKV